MLCGSLALALSSERIAAVTVAVEWLASRRTSSLPISPVAPKTRIEEAADDMSRVGKKSQHRRSRRKARAGGTVRRRLRVRVRSKRTRLTAGQWRAGRWLRELVGGHCGVQLWSVERGRHLLLLAVTVIVTVNVTARATRRESPCQPGLCLQRQTA